MSTIRVDTIQSTSTTDGGLSIDNTGKVTLPENTVIGTQNLPSVGPLSNRNLIINGAMQVAQRGTQVTGVTTTGYRTCDRFKFNVGTLGTWTVDQSTEAPNGFSNSFKATCTTADASPSENDNALFIQQIEAQNLQSLGFGTSDAKPITLSFWVRSNKTGNASFAILQTDNSNKLASFQYSISSADTWEHKTISIPADTAGVINNDNGEGFQLEWWLNSGSTFTSGEFRSTWTSFNNGDRNVSNLGVGGATSDYWQITGVQLEVGETATPFEHRSYGDELARCERYYYKIIQTPSNNCAVAVGSVSSTTQVQAVVHFPVAMRAAPTALEQTGTAGDYDVLTNGSLHICDSVPAFQNATTTMGYITFNYTSSTVTTGSGAIGRMRGSSSYLAWSSEL